MVKVISNKTEESEEESHQWEDAELDETHWVAEEDITIGIKHIQIQDEISIRDKSETSEEETTNVKSEIEKEEPGRQVVYNVSDELDEFKEPPKPITI